MLSKKRKSLVWLLALCFLLTQIITSPIFAQSTGTDRISGADRYKTAVAVSQKGWKTSDYAVLARGDNFADALCAGPLAQKYGGPILLTQPSQLNGDTLKELQRLGVNHLFIAGGVGAVSQSVENSLKANGIDTIERIFGNDRYETSVKIAEKIGNSSKVVLATGSDFPDALSISGIAAKLGMPILLTAKNSLPATVGNYLQANTVTQTYVVGGTGVISSEVVSSVLSPSRLAGNDRYETNKVIMQNFASELDFENIYVAVGSQFADALTGAVLAAKSSAPLVLTGKNLPTGTADYLQSKLKLSTKVKGLGGKLAVPSSILEGLVASKEQIAVEEKYSTAGTYGPETGTKTIQGSVIISSADVTLRNTIIEGDLLLGSSIGDGDVSLRDVTVKGKTIINGGGPNSVIMYNFSGQTVVVDVPDGANVRLVAQGSTSVSNVSMEGSGTLDQSEVTGTGFVTVEIPAGAQVTLSGDFNEVNVESAGANVTVTSGNITTMNISQSASGSGVNLASGSSVGTLNANAQSNVTGQGQITNANVYANGVTISQKPTNTNVAENVTTNVDGEEIDQSDTQPPPQQNQGSGDSGSSIVAVSGVSINQQEQILYIDETVELSISFTPSNATNKNVTWSTSDNNVATVDGNGEVTAVAAGTSTITATSVSNTTRVAAIEITVGDILVTSEYSIQEAVDDAGEGDIIILGSDAELDDTLVINEEVTIEGRGFSINKAINIAADNVIIKNLTGAAVDRASHQLPGIEGANAFYVNGNNILLDNISVNGSGVTDATSRAIIGHTGADFTVRNSSFENVSTGIFAHSGNSQPTAEQVTLTATNNTFTNVWAGIGGTQKTNLTATDNIFVSVQNHNVWGLGEGIGLGAGVVIIGSYSGYDADYLESQNTFNYDDGNKVKDYRPIVNVSPSDDLNSIITAANDDAIILLSAGEYTLTGGIVPNKSITIIGANKDATIVDTTTQGTYGAFQATNDHKLTLKNMTLKTDEPEEVDERNGHYAVGTGLNTGSTEIVIDNCIINGYYAAVYMNNVNTNNNKLTMTNNFITNCDWAYGIDNITVGAQDIDSENLVFTGNTGNGAVKGREVFASAKILLVGSNGGSKGTFGNIKGAIDSATAGDTIMIAAGTYVEVPLSISNQITLMGAGDETIIQAQTTTALLNISQDGVTVMNIKLQGAEGESKGAGIKIASTVAIDGFTLDNCVIEGFTQGIYADTNSSIEPIVRNVLIKDSKFINNTNKGIYIEKLSDSSILDCEFQGNGTNPDATSNPLANASGAGIDINAKYVNYNDIIIDSCTFTNNGTDTAYGGAILVKARGTGDDTSYSSNPATLTGVEIRSCKFYTNSKAIVLGEYDKNNIGPEVTITNPTYSGNTDDVVDYRSIISIDV